MSRRISYWFRTRRGDTVRAKSSTGSVTFAPKLAVKVRKAIARRGGKIVRRKVAVVAGPAPSETQLRHGVVHWALWGAAHEPMIHYSQGPERAEPVVKGKATLPMSLDCSAFATWCYRMAGAPDPSGLGYRGIGEFTGTLVAHMREVASGKVGDLIVYGPGNGDHVVVIVALTHDGYQVVSHGQERGPFITTHAVEKAAHRAPSRILRIPEWS